MILKIRHTHFAQETECHICGTNIPAGARAVRIGVRGRIDSFETTFTEKFHNKCWVLWENTIKPAGGWAFVSSEEIKEFSEKLNPRPQISRKRRVELYN